MTTDTSTKPQIKPTDKTSKDSITQQTSANKADKGSTAKQSPTPTDVKTSKRTIRYILVGITITVFNYGFYQW